MRVVSRNRHLVWRAFQDQGIEESGALGGIRTHDLCLRRAALYPLSYKRVFDAQAHFNCPFPLPPVLGSGKEHLGTGLVPREGFEPTRP